MSEIPTSAQPSKAALWSGRVLSALPVLLFTFSGVMKLIQPEGFDEQFVDKFGIPLHLAAGIGVVELVCAALYAIPRTTVLGAILLTGYLGGAIMTHLRVEDDFVPPFVFGIVIWVALYLREPRLRVLAPIRR